MLRLSLILVLLGVAAAPARGEEPFELKNGDRVVLIGSTLVEREQSYGYLETALFSRYPDRNITVRNLGWSGDTVFGEARAGFGSAEDGYQHLKELTLALKPTVILVAYGTNESFAGENGLRRFTAGLNTLLDTLAPTKARIVLLSPLKQEKLPPPLPDPAQANARLQMYSDRIKSVAAQRGLPFIDLYAASSADQQTAGQSLTDNGVHLIDAGYWRAAAWIEKGLGLEPPEWSVAVDGKSGETSGLVETKLSKVKADGKAVTFEALDAQLPWPAPPSSTFKGIRKLGPQRRLTVTNLPTGFYAVKVDGKQVLPPQSQSALARGVMIHSGPEFEASEKLRQAVLRKDRFYFYRWRPQNETYLFGFRKYEQGQNAREVVLFDPLVAAQEAEIAKLRQPQSHKYEIVLVSQGR